MLMVIMNELNYVGVMVMECFVIVEGLLINELVLWVYNSGYWMQNGVFISQFELYLWVIIGLLLLLLVVNSLLVMINLIGIDFNYDWLKLLLVYLYWYDKEVCLGCKVGYLNFIDSDIDCLSVMLEVIKLLLLLEYISGLFWV